ncbi:elongator complex protein 3 [Geomonas sp.]|uniref:elongator complex protein 3 n=1 Tax=Geomonas sp. TaxID=2651584 RepID=UPI002B49AB80|nr:radical SAM protein [Geomonas sp.]HJV36663.1 radical SAM protein [Geomonas sp.]
MRSVIVPFFISHLGCPHRCVFCDQQKIAGAKGVLPDAAAILEKVAQYQASAPGRELEVAFYGGTFTALPLADQQRLLDPLQPLLSSGAIRSVRLSTRPDAVDAGVASFLKSKGVETVELGVQSMDEEVLRLSRRGHSAADVEAAVSALKKTGLSAGIQLMPGLPGDSAERSLDTLRRVLSLQPSFLRIYPTLVIAGTELAELYQGGHYHPLSLEEAVSLCKQMLVESRRCGVPVIRVGLQPTSELESPGVLQAGPYHPAFGQLVESEIWYDIVSAQLAQFPRESLVELSVPMGRVSDVVGQKRLNVQRLAENFGVSVLAVREDADLGCEQVTIKMVLKS